jgi:ankyrin repeat protein
MGHHVGVTDVDVTDDEWIDDLPPLVRAAALGDAGEVAELLRTGIDANQVTGWGWSALHAAARFNHLQVVVDLLAAGANVDARDDSGFTPLLTAAEADAPIAAALLGAGADPMAQEPGMGWRPLDRFAGYDNAPTVALLLKAGVEVDALTSYGATALMSAAEEDAATCVRLLLDAGADPSLTCEGETPAELATKHGYLATAALITARR